MLLCFVWHLVSAGAWRYCGIIEQHRAAMSQLAVLVMALSLGCGVLLIISVFHRGYQSRHLAVLCARVPLAADVGC